MNRGGDDGMGELRPNRESKVRKGGFGFLRG